MENDKPFFRVVGIAREGKSIVEYAAELEETMNGLMGDGYVVHTEDDLEGTLIHGELDVEALDTAPTQSEYPGPPHASPAIRTKLLVDAFADATNLRVCDVEKNARNLTKGYSVEELREAAAYVEEAAKSHAKHDKCTVGQFLEAVAKVVKQVANENLQ